MTIAVSSTSVVDDPIEITEADLAISQAVYSLWDAERLLASLMASDVTPRDIRALTSDVSDILNQLQRLQSGLETAMPFLS